jgi:hypothetical protein
MMPLPLITIILMKKIGTNIINTKNEGEQNESKI